MNRRNNRVPDGDSAAGDIDDHERFNLNQYYNAVEDEQIYIDEYTSLTHRYNDFIVNTNTMFMRMEQTLRESITRTITRQSYYHRETHELRERMGRRRQPGHIHHHQPLTVPSPPVAPPPVVPPRPEEPVVHPIGDVLPRLISRYITADRDREYRGSANNIFSMLYTIPAAGGAGADGARAVAGAAGAARVNNENAPTNQQIQRATHNTVFSNIISPMNATCPISRDEFNDTSEITMIRGCNHIFNRDSLREWFTRHPTCPMCRLDIRQYQPDGAPAPAIANRNLSIHHADDDHITFSFDLPIENNNNNNDDIYRDIVGTLRQIVRNTASASATASATAGEPAMNDDDDIMEVD